MCGLSAIINFRGADRRLRANPADLRKMTDLVRHRGPDGEGYVLLNEKGEALTSHGAETSEQPDAFSSRSDFLIGLGHRRLAIVELSDLGHQPMTVANGRYWIVYNGEIYNHASLAEKLRKHGIEFSGHSDTEVLLNAYRVWGTECLTHLNGMFSFVIVDRHEERIFAARDRFGIKPLYYWLNADGFLAFASEIKQFTALPGWTARANPQRAYDFLAWGATDHTDETLFSGVMQLGPGQALDLPVSYLDVPANVGVAHLPTYSWYQLETQTYRGNFADASAQMRELFEKSIQRRMRSDVPVGACLSGGLDSSSIVSVIDSTLDEHSGHRLSTFSACSELARVDERKWIDVISENTSTNPHYVYPSVDELLEVLPKVIWHQDEPFATTNIFAQWSVFQMVGGTDVKVVLDGQGADEQLAGYDIYFGIKLTGLLKRLKLGRLLREFRLIREQRGFSVAGLLLLLGNCALPKVFVDPLRKLGKRTSLTPDWIDLDRLRAQPAYPFHENSARGGYIQRTNFNQITRTGLQKLLRFEDRNSMAFSIEARVPFLDHDLVEFLLGLPDDYKLDRGITKRILREAMIGILPEPIRNRRDKLGFQTAEQVWMCGEKRAKFTELVREAVELSNGILTPRTTERCEAILNSEEPFSDLPWKVITFGGWIKEYNVTV